MSDAGLLENKINAFEAKFDRKIDRLTELTNFVMQNMATKAESAGIKSDIARLEEYIHDGFERMDVRFDSLENIIKTHEHRISGVEDDVRILKRSFR